MSLSNDTIGSGSYSLTAGVFASLKKEGEPLPFHRQPSSPVPKCHITRFETLDID
jgi:hypothetical protein